jgi:hypothetical protein
MAERWENMSKSMPRIHISEFCRRLYQHAKAEEQRLDVNSDDVYDGFDAKPRPLDAVADFLSQRTGLKLSDVYKYICRAGQGGDWGKTRCPGEGRELSRKRRENMERYQRRRKKYDEAVERGDCPKRRPKRPARPKPTMLPDIAEIAQAMAAFSNSRDMDELLARFPVDYPHEAGELGLLKPRGPDARKGKRKRKPRTELTEKQQYVYELRKTARLSYPRIAEELTKEYRGSTAEPYTKEAARKLFNRAEEVKKRRRASVQTRRPLSTDRRGNT